MTVYDIQQKYNPETGFHESVLTPIYEDVPCRVSKQLTEPTDENPAVIQEKTTLICAPELEINPGCHIEVTVYKGIKQYYEQVSQARNYSDHQTLLMREVTEDNWKYA